MAPAKVRWSARAAASRRRAVPNWAAARPATRPSATAPAAPVTPVISPARNRPGIDRKSTRLNSSHVAISYAVFCLKKKNLAARVPAGSLTLALDHGAVAALVLQDPAGDRSRL